MEIQFLLEIASRSDPGRVRTQNEDALAHNASLGLAILADGMGGYNAGEVASGMATALLKSELEKVLPHIEREKLHLCLSHAISAANSAIFQMAASRQQYNGMGTTLVLSVLCGRHLTVAHLGDSRLYRWRNAQLTQLTQDHSILQEQINAGVLTIEQARQSLHKNLVTRALGVGNVAQPDIVDHEVMPADIYLLCSDGLSDMLDDTQIAALLSGPTQELDAVAQALVDAANQHGGRDNVSVMLLKVLPAPNKPGIVGRLMNWLK